MSDYLFYTYFAEGREHFVFSDQNSKGVLPKEKDFPFLESLLRMIYLDVLPLDSEFNKMDKALMDFYSEHDPKLQDVVMKTLEKLAEQHIYFEFLRLDWQLRFQTFKDNPDIDVEEILPHKPLRQIPSTFDMIQKQVMRLFEDVLDIDDDKKKPA